MQPELLYLLALLKTATGNQSSVVDKQVLCSSFKSAWLPCTDTEEPTTYTEQQDVLKETVQ